ncbi:hypothetical protein K461DRAFT_295446 [Myriangium duriaei CBS 260.36]|uniref:C3H1-type domain-containing protein n=1 Tax=Myriangium duriaei CBS 260.36 TaxID=1168546 RepID=A0A9P4ML52_9PEZI|nr:hypothetical protein K461DRAFT_295446 [Myriangium duriaei CBS 260.36]
MPPGFSFPPPPPPPPKPSDSSTTRGGFGDRGRGRGRGGSRGGRGGGSSTPGFTPTQTPNEYPAGSYVNPHFRRDASQPQNSPSAETSPGQKRKRDDRSSHSGSWRGGSGTHLRGHPMKHPSAPKPSVAPAVPSFGAPLTFTTSSSTTSQDPDPTPLPAPFAPSSPSASSASEDEDEESLLSSALAAGGGLRFQHEDQLIVLSTPAELRTWQDERRKCFPTSSRAAAKERARQARMEERRRIEAETAVAMGWAPRQPRLRMEGETGKVEGGSGGKAAELREKLLGQKRSREVAGGEERLGLVGYDSDSDEPPEVLPTTAPEKDNEESDEAPEVQSAKVVPAPHVPPPEVKAEGSKHPPPPPQQVCRYFSTRGQCRAGSGCRFAHARESGAVSAPSGNSAGKTNRATGGRKERVTLYQRLLEQEQAAENKLALMVVKYLGEKGFFKPKEES